MEQCFPRNQVLLLMFTDFENFSVFNAGCPSRESVNATFDQIIAWGGALNALREQRAQAGEHDGNHIGGCPLRRSKTDSSRDVGIANVLRLCPWLILRLLLGVCLARLVNDTP